MTKLDFELTAVNSGVLTVNRSRRKVSSTTTLRLRDPIMTANNSCLQYET